MRLKAIGTALAAAVVTTAAATSLAHASEATAKLVNQKGESVGTVSMRTTPTKGVWLGVSLTGIAPGKHAFHIHETGKCEGDFKSAGGHYNPHGSKHGMMTEGGAHAGDLPNLDVPENGKLNLELFITSVSLDKGADNTVFDADGSAFIIHEGADDYTSQPTGDAGGRAACGLIEASGG